MLSILPLLSLIVSFILIIVLFVVNFKEIKKQFSGIRKTTWLILSILFIFGFCILQIAPTMFTTLHDETFFVRHARDLSQGNFYVEQKSIGYPFLVGILFFFSGANFGAAYIVNLVLGSLSIILIFFVGYLFFGREDVGLYSSILLSLFIPHVSTSRTLESNTSSIFALLLALICFLLYFKIGTFKSQLLAAVSLSFAVCFRLEFALLPFLFALLVILSDRNLRKNVRNYKWWVPWVVLIVLTAPWMVLVAQAALLPPGRNPYIHHEMMIYDVLGMDALMKNIPQVEGVFVNSDFFPQYMIFFLFLGPLSLLRKDKRKLFFLLTVFIVFMLLPMSFAIPQDRYFLVSYMVMILFWAKGISFLSHYLQKATERKRVLKIDVSFFIFLIASLLIFAGFLPYILVLEENSLRLAWQNREIYLEREALYYLNRNLGECDIVAVDHESFVFENLNPIKIEEMLDNPGIAKGPDGCLLFFEDLYCEAPAVFYPAMEEVTDNYKRLCNQMHEEFNLTVYRRFNVTLPEAYKNFRPEVIQTYWADFTLYNISSK